MACIYKITNQVNGKAYIGKSVHDASKTRIRSHFKGCGGAIALANAIDKYGKDAFTWEILDDGIIPELVDSYEIESIEKHGTLSPSGYNLTRGGESGQFSEESRRKMSESSRAENLSAKTRRKMSEVQKGKKHTKEARRKMSASRIGKKHAKETKRKISEGRRGKKHTEESKCKMSESHKGKPLSEETKHKMSEVRRGKVQSEETRRKRSDANKGKNNAMYGKDFTKEHRRKLSESRKGKKNPNYGKKLSEKQRHIISEAQRNRSRPERDRAYEYYLTLPPYLSLSDKRKKVREFSGKNRTTVYRWVQKWENSSNP